MLRNFLVWLILGLTLAAMPTSSPFHRSYKSIGDIQDAVEVKLSESGGTKLPIDRYPENGKHVSFKLVPSRGDAILLVIKNEQVTDDIMNTIALKGESAREQHMKDRAKNLHTALAERRQKSQGIDNFYVKIGDEYRLVGSRVAGEGHDGKLDKMAMIMVTPQGRLQLFEKGKHHNELQYGSEINTRLARD